MSVYVPKEFARFARKSGLADASCSKTLRMWRPATMTPIWAAAYSSSASPGEAAGELIEVKNDGGNEEKD
jgi:hypothetical protein